MGSILRIPIVDWEVDWLPSSRVGTVCGVEGVSGRCDVAVGAASGPDAVDGGFEGMLGVGEGGGGVGDGHISDVTILGQRRGEILFHPGALLHVYAALSRPRHDAAHAEGAEGAVFLDEAQGFEVGVELLQPRVFDAPRECGEVVEEALGATFAVGDDAHEIVVDVVRASSSGDVAAANEPGKDLWLDLVLARLVSGFVAHRMFGWRLGLRSFVDEFVDDLSAPAVRRFERVEAVPCLLPLRAVRPPSRKRTCGLFLQRLRPVGVGHGPVSLLFGPCGGSGGGEDELAKQSHETVGGRSTGGGPLHHLVVRVLLRADGTARDEHGGHDGVAGSTCTIEGAGFRGVLANASMPKRIGARHRSRYSSLAGNSW